jgi:hypothetical protein
VPDEKILLAEMQEARRRAAEKLEEPGTIAAVFGKQMQEMLTQLSERLAANYDTLEKAMNEKVAVSRQAIEKWRKETREFAALLADLERRLPATA